MAKRKASLGLSNIEPQKNISQNSQELNNSNDAKKQKKIMVPYYINPLLHEALHTIVFSERHKKTSFQTLITEGLDLLLKNKGLPSVEDIISGDKTINL